MLEKRSAAALAPFLPLLLAGALALPAVAQQTAPAPPPAAPANGAGAPAGSAGGGGGAEKAAKPAERRSYDDPYEAYEAGAYDQALEGFVDRQVERPEDPRAQLDVGAARYKLRDWEQADRAFSSAAASGDPKLRARALYDLGNTAFRQGKLDEAVLRYQAALEADPDDADAKFNLEFVRDEIRRRMEEAKKRQEQQKDQPQQGKQGDKNQQGEQGQDQQQKQDQGQQQGQQGQPQADQGGADSDKRRPPRFGREKRRQPHRSEQPRQRRRRAPGRPGRRQPQRPRGPRRDRPQQARRARQGAEGRRRATGSGRRAGQ